ncbi:MAG: hypothetical protein KAV82_06215 [Phycisphaerae bacterium]|nr:hypothetical protein [Phycisphaerae bacterium]
MSTTFEAPRGRIVRVLIAAILTVTCVRVWLGPGDVLPRAAAQIPDSGLQRKKMLDEIQRTNRLLEQIHHTLETQTIKVRVESTDKTKKSAIAPRSPKH